MIGSHSVLLAIILILLIVSLAPPVRGWGGWYPTGGLGTILIVILILILLGLI